ncbi:hypothetical protein SAMN05216593_104105 [Pseudomonas asturiensis]|uniref:Uncharacterized protein n=1 Tax=Pseudomonas asturiensis TaxID=1190415 RepID=A0A1M7MC49_9PSED|nr:hypothetical protein SAMN05216593_104105 [Pseudomonas asturiensis]
MVMFAKRPASAGFLRFRDTDHVFLPISPCAPATPLQKNLLGYPGFFREGSRLPLILELSEDGLWISSKNCLVR